MKMGHATVALSQTKAHRVVVSSSCMHVCMRAEVHKLGITTTMWYYVAPASQRVLFLLRHWCIILVWINLFLTLDFFNFLFVSFVSLFV